MATIPGLLKEPSGSSQRRTTPDSGICVRSDSRYTHSLSNASGDASLVASTNDDIQDTESGVHEQDYNEWIFQDYGENVELDLTPDQAMATLRYFTSTAERANMLTKTHFDDLDVISNLLQEKEKDLELAANIGQSLLHRNKDLLLKIEAMEDFLSQANEREVQLCHEVQLKNKLIKHMLLEEEELDEQSMASGAYSRGAGEGNCKDESMALLQERCKTLERKNNELFSEALSVKNLTDEAEAKEQELVLDCIRQLADAKDQITTLTDEIALKFEDNVQQQEEITELITTVVELQRNHRQLSTENVELQVQLDESQQNQEFLRSQVVELQRKFCECYEMLQNNQEEMKTLRSKVELSEQSSWASESCSSGFYQDSIAMEIEESVRKDLAYADAKRRLDNKVWDTVRCANRLMEKGTDSRPASGRLSPLSGSRIELHSSMSDTSSVSDAGSLTHSALMDGQESAASTRRRRPYAPERLQIVKPMEGSQTLHQWQHLASQNVNAGLNLTKSPNSSPDERDVSGINLEELEDDIFHEDDASLGDEGISFTAKSTTPVAPVPGTVRVRKKSPVINPGKPVIVKGGMVPSGKNKSSTPKSSSTLTVNTPLSSERPNSMTLSDVGSVGSVSSAPKSEGPDKGREKVKSRPRTIITRSSSILASLREGREMLNDNGNGKSKAEVIDILANAMNKVNVEAKTGKRILESISASNVKDRKQSMSRTPVKKEYPSMPKLTKVLEKMAEKMDEPEMAQGKPSLRDLIKTMEKGKAKQDRPASKAESMPSRKMLSSMANASLSSAGAMLPTLLRGTLPVGRPSTPSLLGRMVRSSSHEMPSGPQSDSSLSAVAGSDRSSGHRPLTKSLSSGDLQKFAQENLSRLGVIDPGITNSALNLGRTRRNSSGDGIGSVSSLDGAQDAAIRRRNSSGNLTDLLRKSEDGTKASPPSTSFSSFDPYGITEYFSGDGKDRPTSARGAVAVPKVQSGFLKNLFLGSGPTNDLRLQENKRPNSVIEHSRDNHDLAKSASSAESGLDKVGRAAFNIGDSFGGLGFMNLFGNRGSSGNKK